MSVQQAVWRLTVYALLIAGSVIMLLPFLWMLSTSLKTASDTFTYSPTWIPRPVHWQNYTESLSAMLFPILLKNTLQVTIYSLVGCLLTGTIVAFGFARMRFPGRDFLFLVLLATMMLPGQVTMIPVYIIFKWLRWIDTLQPLWVRAFLGGGAFYIFLMRQFFMTLPRELDEAAAMDGCSTLGVLWRILLPLSKPALATVAIFTFMGSWNDFMTALIYVNSIPKMTLALGLHIFQGAYYTQWNYLMAASLVVMLPCLILFFLAQNYFIQGIALTGMKG
ncbi:MAG: carbohydrate ABC transporter permease [Anaerolineae bacterium]